jgi:hypothetical protein
VKPGHDVDRQIEILLRSDLIYAGDDAIGKAG